MKTNAPKIKQQEYTGIKVSNTLRGLNITSINKCLTLNQQNKVSIITNYYKQNNHITRQQMSFIWKLYWHFVLNDFRYK